MTARHLSELKRVAIEKIIFSATPKEWMRRGGGPWVLDRGEGAQLHDAQGREHLNALSVGVFAGRDPRNRPNGAVR